MKAPSHSVIMFGDRILVRFHALLILTATAVTGLFISKRLLAFGVDNLVVRSCASTVFAYCVFFILVRLWLSYVALRIGTEAENVVFKPPPSTPSRSNPFDLLDPSIGGDFADAEGCLVGLALFLLIVGLVAVAVYLISETPIILTDAAFEFLLAGSLLGSIKKIDGPGWAGSVLLSSWKPFVFILILVALSSFCVITRCPSAIHLRDIFNSSLCHK